MKTDNLIVNNGRQSATLPISKIVYYMVISQILCLFIVWVRNKGAINMDGSLSKFNQEDIRKYSRLIYTTLMKPVKFLQEVTKHTSMNLETVTKCFNDVKIYIIRNIQATMHYVKNLVFGDWKDAVLNFLNYMIFGKKTETETNTTDTTHPVTGSSTASAVPTPKGSTRSSRRVSGTNTPNQQPEYIVEEPDSEKGSTSTVSTPDDPWFRNFNPGKAEQFFESSGIITQLDPKELEEMLREIASQ